MQSITQKDSLTELIQVSDILMHLALQVKFSADVILKYFSYFPQKTRFDISANCLHWRQFA